ncbi:MAG: hypothetical protein ACE5MI_04025 [Acidimicrobiia bacterium]
MRTAGLVVGVALAFGGTVWILQGFDVSFAPKSFMTGNQEWIFLGGAAVAVGIALVVWSRRRT